MADKLRFGTAGLRAALGDGPLRMNVQIVEQVATAIAQWLPAGSQVVIGRDARHGSADFANVTARVLADAGHRPQLFTEPVPTPVVAHAVATGDAAGGVMVTASHNPATDNGYKVYAADGGQILPDDAKVIEQAMDALPWPTEVSTERPASVELLGDSEISAYLTAIARSVKSDHQEPVTDLHRTNGGLTIAYTAMHGVGGELFCSALTSAGHLVRPVPEQQRPDPDFPTAAFPNPEEPGTLFYAKALADAVDADLILANDPDADRLAVAVKRDNGWERLTGDEIGVLLGWYLIGQTSGDRSVASTIVSSSLLGKVAAEAGVVHHETLTGFKWLARTDRPELPLIFAYEEALGYSVLPSIRDKDGISAGLVFAELVETIAGFGHTVDDVLSTLYETHGAHLTAQVSMRFEGEDSMTQMTKRMNDLRENPPTEVADMNVVGIVDYQHGANGLAPANVLAYHLDGGRLIIRPSGTEPKIKAYLEAVDSDRSRAARRLAQLEEHAVSLLGPR